MGLQSHLDGNQSLSTPRHLLEQNFLLYKVKFKVTPAWSL